MICSLLFITLFLYKPESKDIRISGGVQQIRTQLGCKPCGLWFALYPQEFFEKGVHQCVTLENVCYLCCHSRNEFVSLVKTGIKSTKNPQLDNYIGIKGQDDFGTRG